MSIDINWLRQAFPDLTDLNPLKDGGYKIVFSAIHPDYGDVVLKLIPNQPIEEIRRELLAVGQLQASRVPNIHLVGDLQIPTGNCVFLFEKRILGEALDERLKSHGVLTKQDLLRLGLQILECLVDAENVNIVHRDVKPKNIIFDHQGNFWLIDFGIARHLTLDSCTPTVAPFGKFTPGYAPVEQFRNDKRAIDSRTDLFALGVTLYECATGTNPFRHNASTDIEILERTRTMHLPKLSLPGYSTDDFFHLIFSMTQKRPDHRPRRASVALEWMQEICNEEG